MIKTAIVVAALLTLATGGMAFASFFDNFDSYATGPLSVVSGGVWMQWQMSSPENDVVTGGYSSPNAMETGKVSWGENVTYYQDLFAPGVGTAAYGFKFLVHEDANAPDNDTYVGFLAGDQSTGAINYDAGTGLFIIDNGASAGTTTLSHWDTGGTAGGGDFGIAELAAGLALDAWHSVDVLITLAVADPTANDPNDPDGYFNVLLDGTTILSNRPFAMNDAFGLNAVDIYGTEAALNDYILIDDIYGTSVPEPSSVLALAGFLPGLLFLRRRK